MMEWKEELNNWYTSVFQDIVNEGEEKRAIHRLISYYMIKIEDGTKYNHFETEPLRLLFYRDRINTLYQWKRTL